MKIYYDTIKCSNPFCDKITSNRYYCDECIEEYGDKQFFFEFSRYIIIPKRKLIRVVK